MKTGYIAEKRTVPLCTQNKTNSTNCSEFFRIGQLEIGSDRPSLIERCQLLTPTQRYQFSIA